LLSGRSRNLNDLVDVSLPIVQQAFPTIASISSGRQFRCIIRTQGTITASAKRWGMQEAQSGAIIAMERNRVEQFVLLPPPLRGMLKPFDGLVIICKSFFLGSKCRCMEKASSIHEARFVFDVQHLVIHHIFHDIIRH
jgi:hypothetical protein